MHEWYWKSLFIALVLTVAAVTPATSEFSDRELTFIEDAATQIKSASDKAKSDHLLFEIFAHAGKLERAIEIMSRLDKKGDYYALQQLRVAELLIAAGRLEAAHEIARSLDRARYGKWRLFEKLAEAHGGVGQKEENAKILAMLAGEYRTLPHPAQRVEWLLGLARHQINAQLHAEARQILTDAGRAISELRQDNLAPGTSIEIWGARQRLALAELQDRAGQREEAAESRARARGLRDAALAKIGPGMSRVTEELAVLKDLAVDFAKQGQREDAAGIFKSAWGALESNREKTTALERRLELVEAQRRSGFTVEAKSGLEAMARQIEGLSWTWDQKDYLMPKLAKALALAGNSGEAIRIADIMEKRSRGSVLWGVFDALVGEGYLDDARRLALTRPDHLSAERVERLAVKLAKTGDRQGAEQIFERVNAHHERVIRDPKDWWSGDVCAFVRTGLMERRAGLHLDHSRVWARLQAVSNTWSVKEREASFMRRSGALHFLVCVRESVRSNSK